MSVETEIVALESRAIQIRNAPHEIADDTGRRIKRIRLGQTLACVKTAAQQCDYGLGDRKASARQNYEYPLARLHEKVHLSTNIYLVIARIGSRVRGHH